MNDSRGAVVAVALQLCACAGVKTAQGVRVQAGATAWRLAPSEALDALCAVNLLRGDPFYDQFFASPQEKADLAFLREGMGEPERAALHHLETELGTPLSAKLTGIFSVTSAGTLDDLVGIVDRNDAWSSLVAALGPTRYGTPETLAALEASRGDLRVVFEHLRKRGFSARWTATALPAVRRFMDKAAPELMKADVVGLDEQVLGRSLHVPSLTAYALAYAKPHGIRLEGWGFVTDIAWPVPITVKTALHELLHPPFQRTGELDARLNTLQQDAFFQRLVHEHDPAFGYTSPEGLVEEDCVTAVDVFNTLRLGLALQPGQPVTPEQYFAGHDDGIHVLAFILFHELQRADVSHWTTYEEFLLGLFRSGRLDDVKRAFEATPGHYPVKALSGH